MEERWARRRRLAPEPVVMATGRRTSGVRLQLPVVFRSHRASRCGCFAKRTSNPPTPSRRRDFQVAACSSSFVFAVSFGSLSSTSVGCLDGASNGVPRFRQLCPRFRLYLFLLYLRGLEGVVWKSGIGFVLSYYKQSWRKDRAITNGTHAYR